MDYQGMLKSFERGLYSPVYLLYGEETYLRDNILAQFKKKLMPDEVGDFNMDIVDGQETTPEAVVTMANTLPFMSEKRLVIVNYAPWFEAKKKPAKEDGGDKDKVNLPEQVLLDYLENPLDSTCLVFTANSADKRKKLYKTVEKKGQIIQFTPLKGKELNDWITGKAHRLAKKIAPAAMAGLVTAVGSNLRLLENELGKLALYVDGRNEITAADIEVMVSKTVESSIFDMVDAVGERRANRALQIIREIIFYGEPPIKILHMIVRQFRIITVSKEMTKQGYSEKQVAGKIHVHPFVAQKCVRQGSNFTEEELHQALFKLLDVDEAMKTGKQEPVLALERLIVELCS